MVATRWSGPPGTRLSRRSALRGLGTVLAGAGAGAIAAACGGPHRTGSRPAPAASGQAGKPRYGGQFNTAQKYDPSTFDPATKQSDARQVANLTSNGLLTYKVAPDVKYGDYVVAPSLAERWETPDAQTYTFHLRPAVKFADLPPVNGRAFSAADAKWTLEYLSRTGSLKQLAPSPSRSMFEGLNRIEAPDQSTVVAQFAQPFAPFISYMGSEYCPMLAHEIFDTDGDFSKRSIGTGPWQLDLSASQKGSHFAFKKNPTYFASGLPYIDTVNWLVLPEDATVNVAFQTKQVDMIDYSGLSADTVEQMKKALPGLVVEEDLGTEGTFIYMNASKAPMQDARIRKAFALSINRGEFVKTFTNGKGAWALASSLPGLFTPEETKQILTYDPNAAKQLVAAAGFANGVDIEFIYPGTKYGQELISKLQLLQSQVKSGGINLTLKSLDSGTEDKRRRSGDYQVAQSPNAFLAAGDLDAPLYGLFDPKSTNNFSRVNDPKLTEMVEAQRHEPDRAKRRDLWRQAIRYLNDVPWAQALIYEPRYALWHPYLKNYARNAAYTGIGRGAISAWLER